AAHDARRLDLQPRLVRLADGVLDRLSAVIAARAEEPQRQRSPHCPHATREPIGPTRTISCERATDHETGSAADRAPGVTTEEIRASPCDFGVELATHRLGDRRAEIGDAIAAIRRLFDEAD